MPETTYEITLLEHAADKVCDAPDNNAAAIVRVPILSAMLYVSPFFGRNKLLIEFSLSVMAKQAAWRGTCIEQYQYHRELHA